MTGLQRREAIPRSLVRLGFQRPRAVLAVWALIACVATLGVLRLKIETSTDSVLDRSGEPWQFYQKSQDLFGGDEILAVVLEGQAPLDAAMLEKSVQIGRSLERVPGVRRVDSLATVPLVHTTPDGTISLEPALKDGIPPDGAAFRRLRRWLLADRLVPRNLLSKDLRAVAVNILLGKSPEKHYPAIFAEVNGLLGAQHSWVSGVPVFRTEADVRTAQELAFFVPLTVVLVALLLLVLFGSVRAVAIPLGVSALGTWVMLGVMGAVGEPLTISTVILPSILLALGCAYSIHELTIAVDCERRVEFGEALEDVALPIALSGLTTAVGFTAVSLVRIDVIRDVGGFGALGVMVTLVATLTAMPAALRLWPLKARRLAFQTWLGGPAAQGLIAVISRRPLAIVIGWLVGAGVLAAGVARLNVETDAVKWFSRTDPVRVAYESIRDLFSGISPMNVVVEATGDDSVAAPAAVDALSRFTSYLESLPDVGKAISIADPLLELHREFTGGSPTRIPRDAATIEQYLLILESSEYMRDLVTADRRFANVRLRANDNGSHALVSVAAKADAWWKQHGPPGYAARTTGIMYEFARAENEITMGQLRGLTFAFAVIAVILLLVFRSFRLAAVALIPNVLPVGIAFGVMGFLGVPLDAGTVLVGNLALGIAVDDTIHVVTGFCREQAATRSSEEALRRTFEKVLCAVVFTSLVIAGGFAVFGFSGLAFTRHLGLVTAGVMVVCLLADTVLLPALLLRMGRRREKGRVGSSAPAMWRSSRTA